MHFMLTQNLVNVVTAATASKIKTATADNKYMQW